MPTLLCLREVDVETLGLKKQYSKDEIGYMIRSIVSVDCWGLTIDNVTIFDDHEILLSPKFRINNTITRDFIIRDPISTICLPMYSGKYFDIYLFNDNPARVNVTIDKSGENYVFNVKVFRK